MSTGFTAPGVRVPLDLDMGPFIRSLGRAGEQGRRFAAQFTAFQARQQAAVNAATASAATVQVQAQARVAAAQQRAAGQVAAAQARVVAAQGVAYTTAAARSNALIRATSAVVAVQTQGQAQIAAATTQAQAAVQVAQQRVAQRAQAARAAIQAQADAIRTAMNVPWTERLGEKLADLGRRAQTTLKRIALGLGAVAGRQAVQLAGMEGMGGMLLPAGAADQAMDLEAMMVRLQRATGGTDAQIRTLAADLRAMATTMPGVRVEDAFGVATMAAKMGVASPQLRTFTRDILRVGVVLEDVPLEEATSRIIALTNVFHLGTDRALNLASALNKLDLTSNASASGILNVTNRLAPGAAFMGLMAHQTMALATALVETRVPIETAGTSINQVMGRMADRQWMGDFARMAGMTGKAFKDLLQRDALGALVAVEQGIGRMNRFQAVEMLNRMSLDGQRVRATMLALSTVLPQLEQHVADANQEWETGASIMGSFAQASGITRAQVTLMQQNVQALAQDLGHALLPVVRGLSEGLQGLATDIRAWANESGPTFEAWGKTVGDVFRNVGAFWRAFPQYVRLGTELAKEAWTQFTAFLERAGTALWEGLQYGAQATFQAISQSITLLVAQLKDELLIAAGLKVPAGAGGQVGAAGRLGRNAADLIGAGGLFRQLFGDQDQPQVGPGVRQGAEAGRGIADWLQDQAKLARAGRAVVQGRMDQMFPDQPPPPPRAPGGPAHPLEGLRQLGDIFARHVLPGMIVQGQILGPGGGRIAPAGGGAAPAPVPAPAAPRPPAPVPAPAAAPLTLDDIWNKNFGKGIDPRKALAARDALFQLAPAAPLPPGFVGPPIDPIREWSGRIADKRRELEAQQAAARKAQDDRDEMARLDAMVGRMNQEFPLGAPAERFAGPRGPRPVPLGLLRTRIPDPRAAATLARERAKMDQGPRFEAQFRQFGAIEQGRQFAAAAERQRQGIAIAAAATAGAIAAAAPRPVRPAYVPTVPFGEDMTARAREQRRQQIERRRAAEPERRRPRTGPLYPVPREGDLGEIAAAEHAASIARRRSRRPRRRRGGMPGAADYNRRVRAEQQQAALEFRRWRENFNAAMTGREPRQLPGPGGVAPRPGGEAPRGPDRVEQNTGKALDVLNLIHGDLTSLSRKAIPAVWT